MSLFKNSLVLLLSVTCLFFSTQAGAQIRPDDRVRMLENRVNQLESLINQLHQRVSNLEYNQRPQPYPEPLQEVACLIEDTGYNKVFLGKGRTRLEAEAVVRELCSRETHPTYCQAQPKCSNPREERGINGALCVMTDTGYSKTFKAEGKSLIEAEFNVRKACGSGTHPSYCKGPIRCESF